MRTLLLATSALLLCGAVNVAWAGGQTLSSNAPAAVDWKYDLTSPETTLSARSQRVETTGGNLDVKIGGHALSAVRSAAETDNDVLSIANSTGGIAIEGNSSLSHSLSSAPLSTESSKLLPTQ